MVKLGYCIFSFLYFSENRKDKKSINKFKGIFNYENRCDFTWETYLETFNYLEILIL